MRKLITILSILFFYSSSTFGVSALSHDSLTIGDDTFYLVDGKLGLGTTFSTAQWNFVGDSTYPYLLKFTNSEGANEEGFWFDATGFSDDSGSYLTLYAQEEDGDTFPLMLVTSKNIAVGGVQGMIDEGLGYDHAFMVGGDQNSALGNTQSKRGTVGTYNSDSYTGDSNCHDPIFDPGTNSYGNTDCTNDSAQNGYSFPKRYGQIKSNGGRPIIVDQFGNTIEMDLEWSTLSESDEFVFSITLNSTIYMPLEAWDASRYDANNEQKTFIIDHPSKTDHYLVHTALEGPTADVAYFGEGQLEKGKAVIHLPDYFDALTLKENRNIFLTPINGFDQLAITLQDNQLIKDNTFIVYSDNDNSNQAFHWKVIAPRKDVGPFDVEPDKDKIINQGFGPYRYSGVSQ